MRAWACRCLALSLGMAVLTAAAAETEDQGQTWLTRMMESGASLDYQGTFVYARGGALEAMRIVNRINGGEAAQHMVALTGMPRQLLREKQTLTLVFPGHTKIMQADNYHAPPFPLAILSANSLAPRADFFFIFTYKHINKFLFSLSRKGYKHGWASVYGGKMSQQINVDWVYICHESQGQTWLVQ